MEQNTPVVIIGGGDSYDSEAEYMREFLTRTVRFQDDSIGWKTLFYTELSNDFRVLIPSMPRRDYAQYNEWKEIFEQFALTLGEKAMYIGHSLGGIFLAKYLAENKLTCRSLHLIAAPFRKVGKFELPTDISRIESNARAVHLWHSEDDRIVDIEELALYAEALPQSQVHLFRDRGHFNGTRFDELATILKNERE